MENTFGDNPSLESLLKRVNIFLEDEEWNQADVYCEKILDLNPENAWAYLGKLMAECHIKEKSELKNYKNPLDQYNNYKKAVRYADKDLRSELEDYNSAICSRMEKERCESVYSDAIATMNGAKDIPMFNEAIRLFELIPGWNDSDKKITYCKQRIIDIEEKKRINEENRKREEERKETERIEKRKSLKKKVKIVSLATLILGLLVLVFVFVILPFLKKGKAQKLIDEGRYVDAYEKVKDIRDDESRKMIEAVFNDLEKESIMNANIGSMVYFGHYEQDGILNNGSEIISWRVLDKKDDKILIISENALGNRAFNEVDEPTTWDECSLRRWLNDEFIRDAFSEDEQNLIEKSMVIAHKNQFYDIYQGQDVEDKIFLLSMKEAQEYFKDNKDRICYDYNGDSPIWWLRTMGSVEELFGNMHYGASYVTSGINEVDGPGVIKSEWMFVDEKYAAIRPAIWITLR